MVMVVIGDVTIVPLIVFLWGDYDDDDDGDDHDDDIEKYKSLRSDTLIVIGVL